MFKYYIVGNVYKDKYVICNCVYSDFYSKKPYTKNKIHNYSEGVGGCWANYYEYDIEKLNIDFFMHMIDSFGTHYEGEGKRKAEKVKMITNHEWNRCQEIDTIETDREFRNGEIILIDNVEYQVIYRYNSELNRHELYIDYEIKIENDEELKEKCKNIVSELNERIEEYNIEIDKIKLIEESEQVNLLEIIKQSFANKVLKYFRIRS